jgi:hypothetical protein
LKKFPTDFYTNWQWFDLLKDSKVMLFDDIQQRISPIIRVIDDWNTNNSLGLLFEAQVGYGTLMVCSMDLQKDFEKSLVKKQMFCSILNYMSGSDFRPSVKLTSHEVKRILDTTEDCCSDSIDFEALVHHD